MLAKIAYYPFAEVLHHCYTHKKNLLTAYILKLYDIDFN